MSGVVLTTPLRRSRASSRSAIVTPAEFATLISLRVCRTHRRPGSFAMLVGCEAVGAGRAEGAALELDLNALAAAPIEIQQQVTHRARLDRVDERGNLLRIGRVDRAGLGDFEMALGDELARARRA